MELFRNDYRWEIFKKKSAFQKLLNSYKFFALNKHNLQIY